MTYKSTKIKAAIKIISDTYPRMKLVKRFDVLGKEKKRKSLVNDAMIYSDEDFDAKFEIDDDKANFRYKKDDEVIITLDSNVIGRYLKEKQVKINEEVCMKSTWQ